MNQTEFRIGAIRPVECFKEAWEIIKPQFWLLFGITLVGAMIGSATLYILLGAMVCGIYYCYLQVIDGQQITFDDLFKGLGFWLPGLIVTIFFIVPTLVFFAIAYLPIVITIIAKPNIGTDELWAIVGVNLVVDIIFSVVMVCFHTLLMFSYSLVVDRKLTAVQAMKTSARAVWANLGGVAKLYGVGFLVTLAGMLVFCIGVYLTIPLVAAANVVAYRKIFPKDFTA
jgi:hypothetical protein